MKICGIYIIKNTLNENVYVGQSFDIIKRFSEHTRELNKNAHANNHLQYAWSKYGVDSFVFEIIEKCDLGFLDEREIYYINYYKSFEKCYNQTEGGRANKRRSKTNKCLECEAETRSYSKYCKSHRHKCQTCKKRYGKKLNLEYHLRICPYCNLERINMIYSILVTGKMGL